MSKGVFVTGTDTGIGKTVVSCALIHALVSRGVRVAPMKPVAAGVEQPGEDEANADSLALIDAAGLPRDALSLVTPFLFREAIAPHIAAAREARQVALAPIEAARARLAVDDAFLVVEGVGGWCVPLAPGLDTVDLARALGYPVVLVVGMRLGCLNHALLTAQAVKASGLPMAGWVANTLDPGMPVLEENLAALRERLAAPMLGHLPHLPGAHARDFARHLDVASLVP